MNHINEKTNLKSPFQYVAILESDSSARLSVRLYSSLTGCSNIFYVSILQQSSEPFLCTVFFI